MKKNLLYSLFTLILTIGLMSASFAQKWTGGGDGTSWHDPANWDSGEVPAAGALLKFAKDATLTGDVPNIPAQIKVQKNITVTFDLDLTLGDGVIAEHALTIATGSTVNIGTESNGRALTINVAPNKQGIAAFGANENLTLNIHEGSVVHAVQTQFGVNLVNETTVMNNWGTIIVEQGVTTGLKTGGTYNNYGVVDATNAGNNGIITALGGTFINHETGVINITTAVDDCIEVQDGSTFINHGTLNVTKGPEAGPWNTAIVVSGKTTTTTFVNDSEFPLNIVGASDTSRIFQIDTMGVFENHSEINFTGVNVDSSMLVQGVFSNMAGATFNVLSGFINVGETGNFTNDWVITMADGGSVFDVLGTTTNNGFYNYASGAAFAEGVGTITDNGLPFISTIDANGECTVNLANLSLEWFEGENSIGTSDETGSLTFAEASLVNDPTTLTTTIDGVEVTVENYCPEAWIDPAGVFNIGRSSQLEIYPTIVNEQHIMINLEPLSGNTMVRIMDVSGHLFKDLNLTAGVINRIELDEINPGIYIVYAMDGSKYYTGKFIVVQ